MWIWRLKWSIRNRFTLESQICGACALILPLCRNCPGLNRRACPLLVPQLTTRDLSIMLPSVWVALNIEIMQQSRYNLGLKSWYNIPTGHDQPSFRKKGIFSTWIKAYSGQSEYCTKYEQLLNPTLYQLCVIFFITVLVDYIINLVQRIPVHGRLAISCLIKSICKLLASPRFYTRSPCSSIQMTPPPPPFHLHWSALQSPVSSLIGENSWPFYRPRFSVQQRLAECTPSGNIVDASSQHTYHTYFFSLFTSPGASGLLDSSGSWFPPVMSPSFRSERAFSSESPLT